MSEQPLLSCKALEKSYQKEGRSVDVLRGVDLELEEGACVAILGKSGSGKSTLLHCLGTLEPATKGDIFYAGKSLQQLRPDQLASFRNRELGFVFQFHYLLQEFTALENVLLPALIAGESREHFTRRATTLLEDMGLQERLHHRPAELSGGEQQRVALARALVMQPRLLLADEPTGNLDSANAGLVKDLLLRMNRERGITILLVTHDEKIANDFSRQIRMEDGKIRSAQ